MIYVVVGTGFTGWYTALWAKYNNAKLRADEKAQSLEGQPTCCTVSVSMENFHLVITGRLRDGVFQGACTEDSNLGMTLGGSHEYDVGSNCDPGSQS